MGIQPESQRIIGDNPIGKGLDDFRSSFNSICETPDAIEQLDQEALQKLVLAFLSATQNLPAARLLPAATRGTLRSDLLRLELSLDSGDFDLDRLKPAIKAALADDLNDALVWGRLYEVVSESTPPPRPIIASSVQQTPWLRNTSSFANSSKHRKYVDDVLKEELGPMYVGLRDFHKTYFGDVPNLEAASRAFFDQCSDGSHSPLFSNGWRGWPEGAKQDDVLRWFGDFTEKLAEFAQTYNSSPAYKRKLLAKPDSLVDGSVGKRKLDIGFMDSDGPDPKKSRRHDWTQILVPGELKSNPTADRPLEARLDLGRYAREVLAAQDTRRFVLGFTLCGSLMRVWGFDRLGGIASEQFDINKNGLQFISTVLGFLWMSEEALGFDPTIRRGKDGQRLVTIKRNGLTERLVIDKTMKRAPCVAGRATTCWKAHREGNPQDSFVIKDSWQYVEREEEGDLLKEATYRGVKNVARYFHHETVFVRGKVDDISNLRGGMDVTKAENYRSELPPKTGDKGRSSGLKRTSSEAGATLPPSKRRSAASPTKGSREPPNRVHRRVIVRDFGRPIYTASSPSALLAALEGCITGHESLHEANLLHRDISINNLMINEDPDNPSWPSFLIDLDLAIRKQRTAASGAKGKTGTRAFMAIGALLGEQHSFMHDLESFFWVLFWICVHCDGPGEGTVVDEFDKWNFAHTGTLAQLKKGLISDEADFLQTAEEYFTRYYQPMTHCVNELRKVVFPNGRRWEREDPGLYVRMRAILEEARRGLAPAPTER
ncbi:hypothetical protein F5144DRAFT_303988 [Chaetomium tenue]|uniref:Uncharacterized protein n=1 Tax=Chaetomium tenue TaxID=1854479 RepID=A0ACB7P2W8_9PEZI|nr:hypothetical protein F5144DRAFT_303988 [Chaetomium globosum]